MAQGPQPSGLSSITGGIKGALPAMLDILKSRGRELSIYSIRRSHSTPQSPLSQRTEEETISCRENFAGVIFCGLREQIFAVRDD